jgi:hypothetical protein
MKDEFGAKLHHIKGPTSRQHLEVPKSKHSLLSLM